MQGRGGLRKSFRRGAVRPGVLDVLTALILLALLLWASWKQFPAYDRRFRAARASPPGASGSH
jgi:hypothetical protein